MSTEMSKILFCDLLSKSFQEMRIEMRKYMR